MIDPRDPLIEDVLIATFCALAGWGAMFTMAHIANEWHHQREEWKKYAATLEKRFLPRRFIAQDEFIVCPCDKCQEGLSRQ